MLLGRPCLGFVTRCLPRGRRRSDRRRFRLLALRDGRQV